MTWQKLRVFYNKYYVQGFHHCSINCCGVNVIFACILVSIDLLDFKKSFWEKLKNICNVPMVNCIIIFQGSVNLMGQIRNQEVKVLSFWYLHIRLHIHDGFNISNISSCMEVEISSWWNLQLIKCFIYYCYKIVSI